MKNKKNWIIAIVVIAVIAAVYFSNIIPGFAYKKPVATTPTAPPVNE